ncbi:MAG: hypothetical protein RIK87_26560 [Fuerstiella sp.]
MAAGSDSEPAHDQSGATLAGSGKLQIPWAEGDRVPPAPIGSRVATKTCETRIRLVAAVVCPQIT